MFKVGDVITSEEIGRIGVIVLPSTGNDGYFGVYFEGWRGGHSLHGYLKEDLDTSGYFCNPMNMKLVKNAEPENIKFANITIKGEIFNELNNFEAYITTENGRRIAIYWVADKQKIATDFTIINSITHPPKGIKIKIINSELSGEVYGAKNKKSALIGQSFHLRSYKKALNKKLGREIEIYYLNMPDGGEMKMLAEDCEIQIPTIKGYNAPKDRTIKIGVIVRYKNQKFSKYSKGERFEVMNITKREQDGKVIAELKDTNGKIIKEYARKFKVI